MRRLSPLFVAIFFLVSILGAQAAGSPGTGDGSWLSLRTSTPGEPPSLATPTVEGNELRLDVVVPGLYVRDVQTKAGPRGRLEIPGGAISGRQGEPLLPVLRYLVEVPPGAEVEVQLTPESIRQIRLIDRGIDPRILPVQPPVPKIEGAENQIAFTEDRAVYESDLYLPAESAAVVDRAVMRGRHLALIELRPVRYNPLQGSIEVWSRAELIVTVEGGLPIQALRDKSRLASPRLDGWIDDAVLGAPGVPQPPVGSASSGGNEGAIGMLVVAHDDFVAPLQPFLDWKEQTGFKIELLRTSDLGSNPNDAAVKAAIQSRYNSWSSPALDYVLLVGDTDYCPIHLGTGGSGTQVTDNWYGCLDGTDYLPEVNVARISTRSAAETANVVDKLLTYERALFTDESWLTRAGFIGTNDSSHWALIEGTHDWCIDQFYTPAGYLPTAWSHGGDSCDRHYRSYSATTADIANSIDEGRWMVNYSGHGGYYSWEGPTSSGSYDQPDVRSNSNDDMYPFVISNACITGSLAQTECFGETWQKEPNKGAIAFWGASNNSYWDEDDVLQRALHDRMFPRDDIPPVGDLINITKLDLYSHYGATSSVAYYYDMYNLLSEPSLRLWTRPPRAWSIGYAQATPIGESSFSVTVSYLGQPVAGALVALRKKDDGVLEAGFTGAGGQVTLLLDPAPESVGSMELTVTGQDFRPFEGAIEIVSPDSPWLIYRSHVIDDSAGDGDGHANPGEELVLIPTLENVGEQPGSGLQATLITTTPQWCQILDGQAAYPDLAPHVQAASQPDHFRLRVDPAAPDGSTIGLELSWSADGGSSGATTFGEQVQTVDFTVAGFTVDDLIGGNGNGVAGPGESVDLMLTLSNVGHRDASGISAVLDTASTHVTIVEDTASFPDIDAAGDGTTLTPGFAIQLAGDAPDQQPIAFTVTVTESGSGHVELLGFDLIVSSCAVTASTDVPQPINDNSTIESQLNYPYAIDIAEVNVFVDISHTYQGDLRIKLISPAGTEIVLHDRSGGSTDNIVTWYDTESASVDPLSLLAGENAYGVWRLVVEDEAGGDTGTINGWQLEICGEGILPDPVLEISDWWISDATACDPDGAGDVGETVTLHATVHNSGWGGATNISASLASAAAVAILDGPAALPDLPPGAETTAAFEVLIGAVECRERATFTLDLQANEGVWSRQIAPTLEVDATESISGEDFEHDGAPPVEWSHAALVGVDDWQLVDDLDHTSGGGWSWFCSNDDTFKDDWLRSAPFDLGNGSSTLEFWHWVDLQSGYDGGVLELTADSGFSWQDLGDQITFGAYDRSLSGTNPIAGRDAWTGSVSEWRRVVVDLSPWAGIRKLRVRWRLTCDYAIARTGWWIDDMLVRTNEEVCDVSPCGIPGEVQQLTVDKQGDDALLAWTGDPVCIEFLVFRSSDPTTESVFVDVTSEDPDPTDTQFVDSSSGTIQYWIIGGRGPDGDGPLGHFEPLP